MGVNPFWDYLVGAPSDMDYYVSTTIDRYRERETTGGKSFQGNPEWNRNTGVVTPGKWWRLENGQQVAGGNISQNMNLTASRISERCWDRVNPPPYRTGGPFKLIKFKVPSSEISHKGTFTNLGRSGTSAGTHTVMQTKFLPDDFWPGDDSVTQYGQLGISKFTDLSSYHTRAWDQLKPSPTKWNASQFFYELRDLPEMLRTSARLFHDGWRYAGGKGGSDFMRPKTVADNFINDQFGWSPFISDLQKAYALYKMGNEMMSRLVVQNNTWMKRRCVLEEQTTQTPLNRSYSSGTWPSADIVLFNQTFGKVVTVDGVSCRGFQDIHKVVETKVWAEGSFKFYRPEFDAALASFDSKWEHINRLALMYGLRVNPAVVYKVTPWTWLIDWFISFGSYLQRLNDMLLDGVVSRYLYVMEHRKQSITKTCVNSFWSGFHVSRFERILETKQRDVAQTPYGFNLQWKDFSPRQFAILGAIGIGRRDGGFISRG